MSTWFFKYENPIPLNVASFIEDILEVKNAGADKFGVCRTKDIESYLYLCHNLGYPCWGYEWDYYRNGEPEAPDNMEHWTYSGDVTLEHLPDPVAYSLNVGSDDRLAMQLLMRYFSNVSKSPEVTLEAPKYPAYKFEPKFNGVAFCEHSSINDKHDPKDDKYAGWVAEGYTPSSAASTLGYSRFTRNNMLPEYRVPHFTENDLREILIGEDQELCFPEEAKPEVEYKRAWFLPYPEWKTWYHVELDAVGQFYVKDPRVNPWESLCLHFLNLTREKLVETTMDDCVDDFLNRLDGRFSITTRKRGTAKVYTFALGEENATQG